jgi:hypothetical protein
MYELPPDQQGRQARPQGRFARGFSQRAGQGLGQQAADAARNFYSQGPQSTNVAVGDQNYYEKPQEQKLDGAWQSLATWIGPDGLKHYGTNEARDAWNAKPAPETPALPVRPVTPAPAPAPATGDAGLVRIPQAHPAFPAAPPDDGGLVRIPQAHPAFPAPVPQEAPGLTAGSVSPTAPTVGTPPPTPAEIAARASTRQAIGGTTRLASDETLKTDVTRVGPADVDGFLAAMTKRKV